MDTEKRFVQFEGALEVDFTVIRSGDFDGSKEGRRSTAAR